MLVKSYQLTGIDFGHLGQVDRNNMKQSGISTRIVAGPGTYTIIIVSVPKYYHYMIKQSVSVIHYCIYS